MADAIHEMSRKMMGVTGVVNGHGELSGVISDGGGWRVAGEGAAYWFSPGSSVPIIARHAERIDLPI